ACGGVGATARVRRVLACRRRRRLSLATKCEESPRGWRQSPRVELDESEGDQVGEASGCDRADLMISAAVAARDTDRHREGAVSLVRLVEVHDAVAARHPLGKVQVSGEWDTLWRTTRPAHDIELGIPG